MGIRDWIEANCDRLIVRCVPGLGFSATDVEGARDADLTWCDEIPEAVAAFTGRDDVPEVGEGESRDPSVYWAAEWWHGPRGGGDGAWWRPW